MISGLKLFDLNGKTALITGSSQGIGYALAKGLSDAGSDIILNGRNIQKLEKSAELINANRDENTSYLIVTHYSRILKYLDVNKVHIVVDGEIVKSGSKELIDEVDSDGYTQYQGK